MKIQRIDAAAEQMLDPTGGVWTRAVPRTFAMVPTPLRGNPMIKAISPFIERSTDHGAVKSLVAAALHNGSEIAFRLSWASEKHDRIADFDQFVDGVAVLFPLARDASAITMGAEGKPVNAWYWKASTNDVAFDVVAEGYGSSQRRAGADARLRCAADHRDGAWSVVFHRPLDVGRGHARFVPGSTQRVAFGVWDGGNRERAGRKSFSGDFVRAELEA